MTRWCSRWKMACSRASNWRSSLSFSSSSSLSIKKSSGLSSASPTSPMSKLSLSTRVRISSRLFLSSEAAVSLTCDDVAGVLQFGLGGALLAQTGQTHSFMVRFTESFEWRTSSVLSKMNEFEKNRVLTVSSLVNLHQARVESQLFFQILVDFDFSVDHLNKICTLRAFNFRELVAEVLGAHDFVVGV